MIKDKLLDDLKKAMKEGDEIKKNTIQLIRAVILATEKDLKIGLTEDQIEDILVKERKKREEALAQFTKANRQDLRNQTIQEISCIETYLPQQFSEIETEELINQLLETLDNPTIKDMGKIMSTLKEQYRNKMDYRIASDILKRLLSNK